MPTNSRVSHCARNVDGSGLSASVVARSHEKIVNRVINASGCDIGTYIGPRASHVTVDHVTVKGANFQGIFAQRTSYVLIENSTVTGNGWRTTTTDPKAPLLPSGVRSFVSQAFGISLFGVSDARVQHNRVSDNGRGGVGVMDNGANDPGTINQNPKARLAASSHDVITENLVTGNYNGCAIVAATQNPRGMLSDLVIARNTVTGTGMSKTRGPDIGGIVVAANTPDSSVRNVAVVGNRVTRSWEGGIIVDAEAPRSNTQHVRIFGNLVSGNNLGHMEAPNTAGVIVFTASGAQNRDTVVAFNRIDGQYYGIYSVGDFAPRTFCNHIRVTRGGAPIHHV